MRLPRTVLVVCLFALPTLAAAQNATGVFAAHAFSMQLPPGYSLIGEAAPTPAFHTFGYATDPRPDGNRGLIQVTLFDLTAVPDSERPTLEAFLATMVQGVHRRRANWTERDSSVQCDGVLARRVAWSGSNEPSPERPQSARPTMLRGTMIVGFKDNVAFALHAQDTEPYADSAVVTAERALRTFSLTRSP
jgi:hypothetical protein